MQAILLAAGMATRLRPLTAERPKCLLDVGGKSILERTLGNVIACGVDEAVIVTGFKAEMIRDEVGEKFPALKVAWVHNERFAETNNAYSLLLSEAAAAESFLLLDSDILFPAGLLRELMACPERPCLALDRHPCSAEEIKVLVDGRGYLLDIGKGIEPAAAAGESIGFELFSPPSRDELFATLRKRVVAERRENEFYEASFKEMVERGTAFKAVDTSAYPAMEVDSVQDLERARERFRLYEGAASLE
jgi:choline kinase